LRFASNIRSSCEPVLLMCTMLKLKAWADYCGGERPLAAAIARPGRV
jgi:hypothetical protein